MESTVLHLNVERVTGLQHVRRLLGLKKMKVYAVVSISSDPNTEQKTTVDEEGRNNPTWDCHMQFIINEPAAQNLSTLVFKLWCKRRRRDKQIGLVRVPIRHLLNPIVDDHNPSDPKTGDVEPAGELFFSYGFGKAYISESDDAAHPPPQEKKLVFAAKLAIQFVTSTVVTLGMGALNTVISS